MDLSNFASAFDLSRSGIMNIARADLVDGHNEMTKTIKSELYKLNVYGAPLNSC